MGQTIAEAIWEEGQVAGELRTAREMLRVFLTHRFGPLPEAVSQAIDRATEVARLRSAFQKALNLDQLTDFEV
jgi:hypothetical protein